MKTEDKGILINAIIGRLNEHVDRNNERVRTYGGKEIRRHGGDMFFKLAFLPDAEIKKIAAAAGI